MKTRLGLAVLLAMALAASASAAPERFQQQQSISAENACFAEVVVAVADGDVKVDVTLRNDGTTDVKFGYRATATDSLGGEYRVRFEGAMMFGPGQVISPLEVPFTGSFIGKQSTPSFDVGGAVLVAVDTGVPTGANVIVDAALSSCVGH